MTVDVEDWFQVENFSDVIQRDHWPKYKLRISDNIRKILELFSKTDVHGTFFVLGWIAERLPKMIEEIAKCGHEIGSHGWSHRTIWNMTRSQFSDDVVNTRLLLQDITKQSILGYRAPSFSITQRTLWAMKVLSEAGYMYDSSIFPIHHDLYGIPNARLSVHKTPEGLWEIPLSVLEVGRFRIPVAGGGYFRLYPRFLTYYAIRSINRAGRPTIVFLHPWEFDPNQPYVSGVGWKKIARHRVGIARNEKKLAWLLKKIKFAPAISVLKEIQNGCCMGGL
jgi:polysaccharide deacetylase family protein (PEP-CTERM system associated)